MPFVSIYRLMPIDECNDTGMKKQNDAMNIKVIINEILIKQALAFNSIKSEEQLTVWLNQYHYRDSFNEYRTRRSSEFDTNHSNE